MAHQSAARSPRQRAIFRIHIRHQFLHREVFPISARRRICVETPRHRRPCQLRALVRHHDDHFAEAPRRDAAVHHFLNAGQLLPFAPARPHFVVRAQSVQQINYRIPFLRRGVITWRQINRNFAIRRVSRHILLQRHAVHRLAHDAPLRRTHRRAQRQRHRHHHHSRHHPPHIRTHRAPPLAQLTEIHGLTERFPAPPPALDARPWTRNARSKATFHLIGNFLFAIITTCVFRHA